MPRPTFSLLFIIIIILILLILLFEYNYFNFLETEEAVKPTIQNQGEQTISTGTGFRGPTGNPYIKGPTGPPPQQ